MQHPLFNAIPLFARRLNHAAPRTLRALSTLLTLSPLLLLPVYAASARPPLWGQPEGVSN